MCDTESERETDGEKEKRVCMKGREREEPVCSFHLPISFPGGSFISCSRGGKHRKKEITNLSLVQVRKSFQSEDF